MFPGGAQKELWREFVEELRILRGCKVDAAGMLCGRCGGQSERGKVSCGEPPRRECYISDAVEDSRGEGCTRK